MLDPFIWVMVGTTLTILFLVAISSSGPTPEREGEKKPLNESELERLWQQLRDQTLEMSLLVSKCCPDDVQMHGLVLTAATCLVYPRDNSRRIVTAKMIESRYRNGFAALEEVRRQMERALEVSPEAGAPGAEAPVADASPPAPTADSAVGTLVTKDGASS